MRATYLHHNQGSHEINASVTAPRQELLTQD
jgi:hypothetical protein